MKKVLIPLFLISIPLGLAGVGYFLLKDKYIRDILSLWEMEARKQGKEKEFDREAMKSELEKLNTIRLNKLYRLSLRIIKSQNTDKPKTLLQVLQEQVEAKNTEDKEQEQNQ